MSNRPAELPLKCYYCDLPTQYADSVPDANPEGPVGHGEFCYKMVPLCWIHAMERREVATNRLVEVIRCERQGLARIDRGRVSGLCRCEECGRLYYDHPKDSEYEFLTVVCDGSVAKL